MRQERDFNEYTKGSKGKLLGKFSLLETNFIDDYTEKITNIWFKEYKGTTKITYNKEFKGLFYTDIGIKVSNSRIVNYYIEVKDTKTGDVEVLSCSIAKERFGSDFERIIHRIKNRLRYDICLLSYYKSLDNKERQALASRLYGDIDRFISEQGETLSVSETIYFLYNKWQLVRNNVVLPFGLFVYYERDLKEHSNRDSIDRNYYTFVDMIDSEPLRSVYDKGNKMKDIKLILTKIKPYRYHNIMALSLQYLLTCANNSDDTMFVLNQLSNYVDIKTKLKQEEININSLLDKMSYYVYWTFLNGTQRLSTKKEKEVYSEGVFREKVWYKDKEFLSMSRIMVWAYNGLYKEELNLNYCNLETAIEYGMYSKVLKVVMSALSYFSNIDINLKKKDIEKFYTTQPEYPDTADNECLTLTLEEILKWALRIDPINRNQGIAKSIAQQVLSGVKSISNLSEKQIWVIRQAYYSYKESKQKIESEDIVNSMYICKAQEVVKNYAMLEDLIKSEESQKFSYKICKEVLKVGTVTIKQREYIDGLHTSLIRLQSLNNDVYNIEDVTVAINQANDNYKERVMSNKLNLQEIINIF